MRKILPFRSCRARASVFYKDFIELNEQDSDVFLDDDEVNSLIHGYKIIGNIVSTKIDINFGNNYKTGFNGYLDHKIVDIIGKCLGIDNNCIKLVVIDSGELDIDNQEIFIPLEVVHEIRLLIPEYKCLYSKLLHETKFSERKIHLTSFKDNDNYITYGKNLTGLNKGDILVASEVNKVRLNLSKKLNELFNKLGIEGAYINSGELVNVNSNNKFFGNMLYCDDKYIYFGLGTLKVAGKEFGTPGQCVWHTDIKADLYLCIGYTVSEIKLVTKNESISGSVEYARCKTSLTEYIQSDRLARILRNAINFKTIEKITTYLNKAGISELVIVTGCNFKDVDKNTFIGYKEQLDNGDIICIVPIYNYNK